MNSIENISVIGSGTMGLNISLCFALHGYPVTVYEANSDTRAQIHEQIKKELEVLYDNGLIEQNAITPALARLTLAETLAEGVKEADFVIESIPEKLVLKQELFRRLPSLTKKDTIYATNTSSLDFFKIIQSMDQDAQVRSLVCHWFNPAHLIPLVELSDFGNTSEELLIRVEELMAKANKKSIRILKNVPGLIANRMQASLVREAFALVEDEIASKEDINIALKYGPGARYATTGLLEIVDYGGLDVWTAVCDNLLPIINDSHKTSTLLKDKIAAGKLGAKTGEGFFKYEATEKTLTENFYKRLITQLKALNEMEKNEKD